MLTQPESGPSPLALRKWSLSPASSNSSTFAPVDKRVGSCAEARSCPSRTRMPPRSAPPTTSQRGPAGGASSSSKHWFCSSRICCMASRCIMSSLEVPAGSSSSRSGGGGGRSVTPRAFSCSIWASYSAFRRRRSSSLLAEASGKASRSQMTSSARASVTSTPSCNGRAAAPSCSGRGARTKSSARAWPVGSSSAKAAFKSATVEPCWRVLTALRSSWRSK
mmetsp:Transcript_51504/g.161501  ORF Transcript_51504/g.161501 Transcript_51504/m.161501 type:complete len:221 (-) Transcript_51504:107-769(-)